QEETTVLKLKTKIDKENVHRPTWSKNNVTTGKNCIPLKPSNELTNSTIATDTYNEDNNQTLQLLPITNDRQGQRMTLSQAFHIKNNNKKKQVTTEKPKQDANVLEKPVLGSYRGQIVQSKGNSFRKPVQIKDEHSAIIKKLSTPISKATKPQPRNTSSVTAKSHRASNMMTTTKFVRATSQNGQLLRPPIRSHHSNTHNTQDSLKQGIANVTVRKGSHEKELLQLNTVLSSVKTISSQEVKRNKTVSRSITSEMIARPALSSNIKQIEKSKTIDQCRHTIAKATINNRRAQPKETVEERKARLSEWRASKGKMLKRPPSSVITQPEPEGQNEKPVGSFWTTMAEEDEQRLFTESVNKTFSECLNLINEGCPKEEVLNTLNDLIKNIPDAKKLKYWICLARVEPLTSSIENIISIFEKVILVGAQPIEEMRHTIADSLTMKSQEKVRFGENLEEACATKEKIPEVIIEDIGVNSQENLKWKINMWYFRIVKKEQVHKTEDQSNDVKTPNTETREGCLIKHNVSTTPYLQSVKKKMQFDEINSELKFLIPVRRSQRLQDKTSTLPDMFKDHYPCVSSSEQLTELGNETDAFICRPHAALCRMDLETETT
uniref:Cytoskeleton-associated protein 2 C-terminal domain-containing protein n=1 Tax=Myotis lucifugus TaxID=59463 RepID=G1QF25_MYOLU